MGWVELIHAQRARRIRVEIARWEGRIAELREHDPARYYAGDWNEAVAALCEWRSRDPKNEAQWIVAL